MGMFHRKSVAFDREAFLMQTSGGVSRYFSNLIGQFAINRELNTDPVLLFRQPRTGISPTLPSTVSEFCHSLTSPSQQ